MSQRPSQDPRPGAKPGEQHPHLLRWRAAMAERPSMAL